MALQLQILSASALDIRVAGRRVLPQRGLEDIAQSLMAFARFTHCRGQIFAPAGRPVN
jgi:hypothetical protein